MFGFNKEVTHTGVVERIGCIPLGESGSQHVVLLEGVKSTIVIEGGWMIGEYETARHTLALTMPGDEVTIRLKETKLQSFTNHTLAQRTNHDLKSL